MRQDAEIAARGPPEQAVHILDPVGIIGLDDIRNVGRTAEALLQGRSAVRVAMPVGQDDLDVAIDDRGDIVGDDVEEARRAVKRDQTACKRHVSCRSAERRGEHLGALLAE
jgi:hypothetical protein